MISVNMVAAMHRITAAEASARLGVKRETLYAYVSRGLLASERGDDGRSSTFDPGEVDALRAGRRRRGRGEIDTRITSAITYLSDDTLAYRGTPGLFADNTRSYLYNNNISSLIPGGTIDISNRSMRRQYPTLHVFGFSNTQFGPFKLPLDLTPAGAPGNFLQNSMDLMFLATLTQTGTTWSGDSKLPIPNNPVFGGAVIHADYLPDKL